MGQPGSPAPGLAQGAFHRQHLASPAPPRTPKPFTAEPACSGGANGCSCSSRAVGERTKRKPLGQASTQADLSPARPLPRRRHGRGGRAGSLALASRCSPSPRQASDLGDGPEVKQPAPHRTARGHGEDRSPPRHAFGVTGHSPGLGGGGLMSFPALNARPTQPTPARPPRGHSLREPRRVNIS